MTDPDEPAEPSGPVSSDATSKAPRRPRWVFALVALCVLCCVCGGGTVLVRNPLATMVGTSALASYGISCDERFYVEVNLAITEGSVAPTRCSFDSGHVDWFELIEPAAFTIASSRIQTISVPHVRLALRGEPPEIDAGPLGPVASLLGIPQRVGLMIGAVAQLAENHAPALDAAHVEIMRGDRPIVDVTSFRLDGNMPLGVTVSAITMPSLTGPFGASAEVRIDSIEGSATASEVTLGGDLHAHGSAPMLGELDREGHVTIHATGLDGQSPSYSLGTE